MWGVAEGARRAVPGPVTATAAVLVPVPVPSLSQLLPHPCRCSASVLVSVPATALVSVPVSATAAVPVSVPLLLSRTICWHYPCFSPCPCPCRRCCPGRSLRSPRLERPRLPAPWGGVSRRRPERGWAGRSPGRAAGSRWARGARGAASACSDRGQQGPPGTAGLGPTAPHPAALASPPCGADRSPGGDRDLRTGAVAFSDNGTRAQGKVRARTEPGEHLRVCPDKRGQGHR